MKDFQFYLIFRSSDNILLEDAAGLHASVKIWKKRASWTVNHWLAASARAFIFIHSTNLKAFAAVKSLHFWWNGQETEKAMAIDAADRMSSSNPWKENGSLSPKHAAKQRNWMMR